MRMKKPWMVVIAGPNGAGKSTFYDLVIKDDPLMKNAPFINLDNIARDISEPQDNPNNNMISAGKIAYQEVEKHIIGKKSFVYETTSSGKVHLRFMDEAKKRGFKVATIFIGLSTPMLSYLRVKDRVTKGGHDVPTKDLRRRYPKIMKNFPDMLKRSDIAAVFDNSGDKPFKLIFLMDDKAFRIFYKYPKWLEESIKERKTRKDMIMVRNSLSVHQLSDEQLREISNQALNAVAGLNNEAIPNIVGSADTIPEDARELPNLLEENQEKSRNAAQWIKRIKEENQK